MTRVYLPTTLTVLREQLRDGVFPRHEQVLAQGDDEDAEYDALMRAADASARMSDGPGRRVVIVAELQDPDATVPTALRDVVAFYADPGERPADADPDEDLCWYATQEIEQLLGD